MCTSESWLDGSADLGLDQLVGCLPTLGDPGDKCSCLSSSRRLVQVVQKTDDKSSKRAYRGVQAFKGLESGLTQVNFAIFPILRQVTTCPSVGGVKINLLMRESAKSHYTIWGIITSILCKQNITNGDNSIARRITFFHFLIKDEKSLDSHWFFPSQHNFFLG